MGGHWIGLDVGGANLKVADGLEEGLSVPFALWRNPEQLADQIAELLHLLVFDASSTGIALTMTGELADCYATKAAGVRSIVEATLAAAEGLPVRVATVDDAWIAPSDAIAQPLRVAAANWRLMARYALRWLNAGEGLLIDVGSTTVDLIPLGAGTVNSVGRTDTERLLAGELLYTGVRRTPVCAITTALPYRGEECPVAAELFATTADAWLLLGELSESDRSDTADGRRLTRGNATDRLGRCVCADSSEFTIEDAQVAAEAIAEQQEQQLAKAMDRQMSLMREKTHTLILCGEGFFLVERALKRIGFKPSVVCLADVVASATSECGPAHAAAVLAKEEISCRDAKSPRQE